MKFLSSILALAAFIVLCLAITFSVLYAQVQWLINGTWIFAAVLFLAWSAINLKSIFAFLTKRSTRYGANLAFVVFLITGILLFLNILAKDYHWRKDITKAGLNTLSSQTLKVLRELPVEVKVTYFANMQERTKAEALFKQFAYATKKFKYEMVDPNRQPTLTQSMGIKKTDTSVLTTADSTRQIRIEGTTEEKITNGLLKLLKTKNEIVYFTVGHGERSLSNASDSDGYAGIKAELEKEAYTVKELNLFTEGKIPSDADVLIIADPKSAFFPKELEIIGAWLKGGGNALLALDLDVRESGLSQGSRQIAALLADDGVELMDKMLVDPSSKAANVEPQVLMGFANSTNVITKDFPNSSAGLVANFLFPLTTYFQHADRAEFTVTSLAKTSANAWAESDWKELKAGIARFHEGKDAKGQMDLAIAIEPKTEKNGRGRIVAFATSSFAANGVLKVAGNRDLFLNSVAWLGSQEQNISIRAKDETDNDQLNVNGNMINFVFLITVFVMPITILVAGLWVWRRRLKQ